MAERFRLFLRNFRGNKTLANISEIFLKYSKDFFSFKHGERRIGTVVECAT